MYALLLLLLSVLAPGLDAGTLAPGLDATYLAPGIDAGYPAVCIKNTCDKFLSNNRAVTRHCLKS